ncbi:hypothetical protein [Adhaeretor mobilis]|uniref:Uncharacterized protein n=1 Tax=Adhaeretor mobilis TaxID=1930276 RepID=A0A517N0G5_9BACT|nr:hypothetical protein [Adhaeretor mobilis]QDT00625.1 hypothetical protein HG15A2_39640 [Adhaeretor mobilis]
MKSNLRGFVVFVFTCMLIGCEDARPRQAYEFAVTGLESRILRTTRQLEDDSLDKTDAGVRVRQEFVLPSDRIALQQLITSGSNALHRPLVLWGIVRPVLGNRTDADYGLQLEWLEKGLETTGFFLQMRNEKILKFGNTIDSNNKEFVNLALDNNPSRYDQIVFVQSGSAGPQTALLTKEQYQEIIVQRQADRVGLILKDGTLTSTGPIAYQEDFNSETPE